MNDHDWRDLDYLRRVAGRRTGTRLSLPSHLDRATQNATFNVVPIEIGQSYLSADWSQQLMSIADFIEHYIDNDDDDDRAPQDTGYLAQTQLFDQIAALRADIAIPEYCSICDIGNEDDIAINAWFVRDDRERVHVHSAGDTSTLTSTCPSLGRRSGS